MKEFNKNFGCCPKSLFGRIDWPYERAVILLGDRSGEGGLIGCMKMGYADWSTNLGNLV